MAAHLIADTRSSAVQSHPDRKLLEVNAS